MLSPRSFSCCDHHIRRFVDCSAGPRPTLALRELVYEAKGVLIPCLNLGGGFPSSVKLHGTPEDFKIPAIEEYAEAITKVLDRLPKRQRPQLRLETGRPATRETIAAPLTLGGEGTWSTRSGGQEFESLRARQ